MITITIATLIAYVLYRKSNSNAILTALSAAAIIVLLAALGHRGLPVQAYALSWLIMWLGMQVITPMAEGRWPSLWIGNRCLTFTVITVGV